MEKVCLLDNTGNDGFLRIWVSDMKDMKEADFIFGS